MRAFQVHLVSSGPALNRGLCAAVLLGVTLGHAEIPRRIGRLGGGPRASEAVHLKVRDIDRQTRHHPRRARQGRRSCSRSWGSIGSWRHPDLVVSELTVPVDRSVEGGADHPARPGRHLRSEADSHINVAFPDFDAKIISMYARDQGRRAPPDAPGSREPSCLCHRT